MTVPILIGLIIFSMLAGCTISIVMSRWYYSKAIKELNTIVENAKQIAPASVPVSDSEKEYIAS